MSEFFRAPGGAMTPFTPDHLAVIRTSAIIALGALLGVPREVSPQSLIGAAKGLAKVAPDSENTKIASHLLNILDNCDQATDQRAVDAIELREVPPGYEEAAFARMQRMPYGQTLHLVPGKADTVTITGNTRFVNVNRGDVAFGLDVSLALPALRRVVVGKVK